MDIGAFVQENRRWLIGAAAGGIVYLIASAVIGSIYDVGGARSAQTAISKSHGSAELYGKDVRDAAQEERERLATERARLQEELAFVPKPDFVLDGKGDANQYLFSVGRTLKQGILDGANARDVQVDPKNVSWPVPTSVDEIRGVLLGLDALDQVVQRLFAAADATRADRPELRGLRSILQLKLDERRAQRAAPRRRGEVDLRDLVMQERVTFQFEGDEGTFALFLEACRQPGRTLAIESWQLLQPQRVGDPCVLKGSLLAIAFKPAAEEKL